MKNILLKITILSLTAFTFFDIAFASTIYAVPVISKEGDTTGVIEIFLDTEKVSVNTIDGVASLSIQDKDVIAITVGGSIFSLWPEKPSLLNKKLTFAGGIPGGISGKDLLLFRIIVKASSLNKVNLAFGKVIVYPNDQTLSPINVIAKKVSTGYVVSKSPSASSLNEIIGNDITPPESFNIEFGNDPVLFDGKYFISFTTTDKDSGIKSYEVKEGDNAYVLTGNLYVLQNQKLKNKIIVRATDNAGNIRIEEITPTLPLNKTSQIMLITIIIILTLCYIIMLRRKKRTLKFKKQRVH